MTPQEQMAELARRRARCVLVMSDDTWNMLSDCKVRIYNEGDTQSSPDEENEGPYTSLHIDRAFDLRVLANFLDVVGPNKE